MVVKNETGTTTYVEGTHYQVNYRLGWLKVISGIADAATVNVHGAYNAISGTRINASTVNEIRAQFVLDGINFADKLPCIATVWEGIVAPDTAFDFLADDFNSIPLTGRAKTPVGKSEPFFVELRDAV